MKQQPATPLHSPAVLLAASGGPAALPEGPPGWPCADEEVRVALEQVFQDGDWGRYHGRHCLALAAALAEFHGREFVSLCCSGTIAVELALRGLGVGPNDEVILAGYDFPGNFRAIEAVGALPALVDVDPQSGQLDPDQLDAIAGPRTKAVIASHLHGGVVPMSQVVAAARRHGWQVVEDVCQCPGATVEGRPAGTWGDVGVLSFGGSKLLTAGRGGAVITARADVQQRIKIFCERGNHAFPLSELQAAVLLPQLKKLPERNRARAESVARLLTQLRGRPGLRPFQQRLDQTLPGYYKLGFYHQQESQAEASSGRPRDEFIAAAQAEGIAIDAGFRGFAGRSARRCRKLDDLPHSRAAAERILVLHHPVLLQHSETIDRLAAGLKKVCLALTTSPTQESSL